MKGSYDFREKFGPWAVVTGASVGIGAEFARQLAAHGLNVALVSRRRQLMESLAAEVKSQYGADTRIIVTDLSVVDGWRDVCKATQGLDVGLLVNNAGIVLLGAYLRYSVQDHISLINTNVTSMAALAHVFSQRFVKRYEGETESLHAIGQGNRNAKGDANANANEKANGYGNACTEKRGGIVFLSSVSRNPTPWLSSYSASKAFVTNLAVALRHELAAYGVHVLSLEPRAVDTAMTQGQWAQLGWKVVQPQVVVSRALSALMENKMRLTVSAEMTPKEEEDEKETIYQIESHLQDFTARAEKLWESEMFQPDLSPESTLCDDA